MFLSKNNTLVQVAKQNIFTKENYCHDKILCNDKKFWFNEPSRHSAASVMILVDYKIFLQASTVNSFEFLT